ncbi:MAG: hypothetical protein RL885_07575 [Planctomycetota bacterium]
MSTIDPAGSRAWALLALLTAAVTLTLDFALLRQDERPLSPDEAWHLSQTLDQHESLFGDRPFEIAGTGHGLYPPQQYLIGAIALEVLPPRGWRLIIAAVDAFFWTVLLAAVWAFARQATGRRSAFLAVLFVCTTPLLFTAGRSYFLDFGLTAWIAFTLWALLRSDGGRPGRGLWIVLAGVFLAALQKWSAPLYLVGPALAAAVCFFRWGRKEKARALLGGALITLAIGGCWLMLVDPSRFLGFTKELHESAGAIGLPDTADAASFRYYVQRFWTGNPLAPIFSMLLVPALGLGLWYRRTRFAAGWLLIWLGCGWLTLSLFGRKDPRYLLPLLPAIGLALALGIEALTQRTARVAAGIGTLLILCCCYQLMATVGLIPAAIGGTVFRARLEDELPAVRFDDAGGERAWSLRGLRDSVDRPDAEIAVLARTRTVHRNGVQLELRGTGAQAWAPEGEEGAALERARGSEYLLIKGPPREPYDTRLTGHRESVRRAIAWLPFSRPERYRTRLYHQLPDDSWLTLLERLEEPRILEPLREVWSRTIDGRALTADAGQMVLWRAGELELTTNTGEKLAAWPGSVEQLRDLQALQIAGGAGLTALTDQGKRLVLWDRQSGERLIRELPSPARWLESGEGWVVAASPTQCSGFVRGEDGWDGSDFPRPGVGGPPALTFDGRIGIILRGRQLFVLRREETWRESPSGADYLEGPLLACEIGPDGRSAAWISQGAGGPGEWCFTWLDLETREPILRWQVSSPVLASALELRLAVTSTACAIATTFPSDGLDVRVFEKGASLPVLHERSTSDLVACWVEKDTTQLITQDGPKIRYWSR